VGDALITLGSSDIETAEGLLEARYHHLELLDSDGQVTGGVILVTRPNMAEV